MSNSHNIQEKWDFCSYNGPRLCVAAGLSLTLFFLLVPGKELVGYCMLLASLTMYAIAVRLLDTKHVLSEPLLFMTLFFPLAAHTLIGLWQLVWALSNFNYQGFFVNTNIRLKVSIGAKYLSIVACHLAVLGHYLARYFENRRIAGYLIIIVATMTLGLLNSMIGLLAYFVFVGFDICMEFRSKQEWRESNRLTRIPAIRGALFGTVMILLAFVISGGLVRIAQTESSVNAAIHERSHSSWVTPGRFAEEFCYDSESECAVNASTYLRLSWVRFGLETIRKHPFGIGNVENPLEVALREKYPEIKGDVATDFHGDVIAFGVRFGWVPLTLALAAAAGLFVRTYAASQYMGSNLARLGLGFLVITYFRLTADSVGFGGLALALVMLCGLPLAFRKFAEVI